MASVPSGRRSQCSQDANILEGFESRYSIPQVDAVLRPQLRNRAPTRLELGAHGISRELARRAAEDCIDRAGDRSAPSEIDLDALRDQRVGIRVAGLDDLKPAGEGERLRIGECRSGEIVKADGPTTQTDGSDILQAEPSVARRHRCRDRATNQPRGQRRNTKSTAPHTTFERMRSTTVRATTGTRAIL